MGDMRHARILRSAQGYASDSADNAFVAAHSEKMALRLVLFVARWRALQ